MVWNSSGSVVDVDVGIFAFRDFDFFGRVFPFPQSVIPGQRSKENQQGTDDDTIG